MPFFHFWNFCFEQIWILSTGFVIFQWNIADHISQNRVSICESLAKESEGGGDTKKDGDPTPSTGKTSEVAPSGKLSELPAFDSLWMVLYTRLGDLCVDQRPAVRKSAGQTLFSMIAAHGSLLQQQTWHTVLWKVRWLTGEIRWVGGWVNEWIDGWMEGKTGGWIDQYM